MGLEDASRDGVRPMGGFEAGSTLAVFLSLADLGPVALLSGRLPVEGVGVGFGRSRSVALAWLLAETKGLFGGIVLFAGDLVEA